MDYRESIDFHVNEENGEISATVFGDDLEKVASNLNKDFSVIDLDILNGLELSDNEELYIQIEDLLKQLEEEQNKKRNMYIGIDKSNGYPVVRDKGLRVETIGNYNEYLKEDNKKRIEELTKKYMLDFDIEAFQLLNDCNKCSNVFEINMLLNGLSVEEVVDKVINYIWDRLHECMRIHNMNASIIDSHKQKTYFRRIMPYAGCHYTYDGRYLSYMNFDRDFKTYLDELRERLVSCLKPIQKVNK